jgi:hypothetical protein
MNDILKQVVETTPFIRARDLNHRQFLPYLASWNVIIKICHTIRNSMVILSQGVETFIDLRNEIILSIEMKEQEVSDIKLQNGI